MEDPGKGGVLDGDADESCAIDAHGDETNKVTARTCARRDLINIALLDFHRFDHISTLL